MATLLLSLRSTLLLTAAARLLVLSALIGGLGRTSELDYVGGSERADTVGAGEYAHG